MNIIHLVQKRFQAKRLARKTKIAIIRTMQGVGQEAKETKVMARTFFRMLYKELNIKTRNTPPTKDEINEAIEQLADVGRFSVFSVISVIPGGGFSLIAIELLARKFGIKKFTFIPSSFRKELRKKRRQEYRRKLKELVNKTEKTFDKINEELPTIHQ